ncbi:tRNA uracil 4-sulfurtransferase ThiI [Leptotrichia sp. oral taxon 847]|uniref:tRNA uracil 4-sulfurtransferase ThiI n=1 Tax=Leptotrichia sp. oral taxon 847 TaxID=1785996 RepID=UPI000767EFC3|nr:tRNA uracil 4-sulfurtransferase ThiI [Leptotrichia sp. oral taxon 847]AMD95533.1 thiamine biosynthesis protein ThiI [Leptotrichia sp. oral taxon 847]
MERYTDKNLLDAIGLSYGELSLKGKNRGQFERKLRNRISRNLKEFDYKLTEDLSKLYVLIDPKDLEKITEKLKKVFGIVGINQSSKVLQDDAKIKAKVLEFANYAYEKGARTFKISVNRSNKGFPINSMDYAKEVGAFVLINSPFEKVKMKEPDIMIHIDIRKNVYIYTTRIKTYGGLPLGSTGKGLVLLSGGIDSPVASFMMAKRGMRLNFVTFNSFPFTSKQALEKVKELTEILTDYTGKSRLYTINILKLQEEINSKTKKEYATILTRRVMMRLSERLSNSMQYHALITGESLGQVASQTLGGLTCTNACVEKLPVFRPLIGMDKTEIIDIAKEIGTYEKSIEPHEDSCVIFAPKHPVTNPKLEDILMEEAKIENYEELMDEVFNEREYFNFG